MKNLQHKAALVTGGSRGIGAAIAKRLAAEGAQVAITYQNSSDQAEAVVREIQESGGNALDIQADSQDPQAVIRAVDQAQEAFGSLDILVNNAGIGLYRDFSQFTLEDFNRIISVNVAAVFVASLQAIRYMGPGGRIIHIGSCQADRNPFQGGSLYAMSKSALNGLTRGMARDLGPKGITVNVVHPGPVNTEMNPADGPQADAQRALLAVRDYASGEDIAAMVAFLAGPQSANITGTGLLSDGGMSI